MEDSLVYKIISALLGLVITLISYMYLSQRKDFFYELARIKKELKENSDKDDADRKELEEKIERHYAFKSDIQRLDAAFAHLESDISIIRKEASRSTGLLHEMLLELRKKG
jgi:hypothetical protein